MLDTKHLYLVVLYSVFVHSWMKLDLIMADALSARDQANTGLTARFSFVQPLCRPPRPSGLHGTHALQIAPVLASQAALLPVAQDLARELEELGLFLFEVVVHLV